MESKTKTYKDYFEKIKRVDVWRGKDDRWMGEFKIGSESHLFSVLGKSAKTTFFYDPDGNVFIRWEFKWDYNLKASTTNDKYHKDSYILSLPFVPFIGEHFSETEQVSTKDMLYKYMNKRDLPEILISEHLSNRIDNSR